MTVLPESVVLTRIATVLAAVKGGLVVVDMTPPPFNAVLPEMVESITVSLLMFTMPPPEVPAALPTMAQDVMVRVPSFTMPPPRVALELPPVMVRPVRLTTAGLTTWKIRNKGDAAGRRMVILSAPVPLMVMAVVRSGSTVARSMMSGVPSVKFTVPPVPSEKVMVSVPASAFAFRRA